MTFQDDNGNTIEFGGEIAMTKRAVSFFNFAINGDASQNFQLDNNAVNRKALNYSGPQMLNQIAWVKQPFKRMRNGNVLDRGYIVIQDETEEVLDCFYVSGNSNWTKNISGLITDLDWSGYAEVFNAANVITRASATSGVTFPMVEWTQNLYRGFNEWHMEFYNPVTALPLVRVVDSTNNKDNALFDFYPCLYLKTLVEELLAQNGLKLSGTLVDDLDYQRLIVTPVSGVMKRLAFNDVSGVQLATQVITVATFTKLTNIVETADSENLFLNSTYTANKKTGVNVSFTSTVVLGAIDIHLYKNGVSVQNYTNVIQGTTYKFALQRLQPNDTIELYAYSVDIPPIRIRVSFLLQIPSVIQVGDYVSPSNFLPAFQGIDVIKFIQRYFGCVVYFNDYSHTISINIIEKMRQDAALDWSNYYLSHRSEYTVKQAQNNYLRLEEPDEIDLKKFRNTNPAGYGEGIITTPNTLSPNLDIFKIPFAASGFGVDSNGVWLTNVPLINLVDSGAIAYTGITNIGAGVVEFTYASGPVFFLNEIIRITNSKGVSLGYFAINSVVGATTIRLQFPFVSTDTGVITRQKINYNTLTPRLLINKPSTAYSDFASDANGAKTWNKTDGFYIYDETGTRTAYTSIAYATYCKKKTMEPVDVWTGNVAFANPTLDYADHSGLQTRFRKITKMFQNPDLRFQLLLPETDFENFNFSNLVYIKTAKITGYFFVESIVNYKNGNTPVEVNMSML